MINFWNRRVTFRKSLTLKNKIILVIESIHKDENITISEAIERLMETSPVYKTKIGELKEYYHKLEE